MLKIQGYKILAQIYESNNSIVYKGIREKDNYPVILKWLRQDYPTPEELTRYHQEYEITSVLNSNKIIKSYSLEKKENTLIIIFEDFDGTSLNILLKKNNLSIKEFLEIAIAITSGLEEIHTANIIHKDINPSNIVYNAKTKQLKIIDFGISTILEKEIQTFKNPNILEGTLAYIAPEQTGRINSIVDCRSDFYSLGVTFYELLTKQLPFQSLNLLELIHSHIAKNPIHPEAFYSECPPVISDIILKLMDKNIEKRYQSAGGLKVDLEKCLEALNKKGKIDIFKLGNYDISDRLKISQKLYGRENEINSLLRKFTQFLDRETSTTELILISGYSGVGKSTLIREVYKPITLAKGYFLSGKFDQYQGDRPYSAIIEAFLVFTNYLLSETKTNLARWKNNLLAALKDNGQLIIDLIPELEKIIGKQPSVVDLSPSAAQNRFYWVFNDFVKVFARKEHPLVIFLDDLQWADSASLQLIQSIMIDKEIESLFLIGAYRDNEVSAKHPLRLTIDKLRQAEVNLSKISLLDLKLSDISRLISDSFSCTLKTALPLGELILDKTKGNPFFITEFLRSLYREKVLYFNNQSGNWQWDLEEIKEKNITDNVGNLLSQKIQTLNIETQKILQLAACIGNQFEIRTLATISEKSFQETALLLQPAIEFGLILPLTDTSKLMKFNFNQLEETYKVEYKFAHDRIQQAVYILISQVSKKQLHQRVAEFLLKSISKNQLKQNIFKIVNQFNLAVELIVSQEEQYRLAEFNLLAGKEAKASTAYPLSFTYLQKGIKLLGKNYWQQNHILSLSIFQEAVEIAYANGDFKKMEEFCHEIEKNTTLLEQVKIYKLKIAAYEAQNKLLEAADIGLSLLKKLGISFPDYSNKNNLFIELERTELSIKDKLNLIGGEIHNLSKLPKMDNFDKLAAIEILDAIISPAYGVSSELFFLIICKGIQLTLEFGNSPFASRLYIGYGIIFITEMGNVDYGYNFAKLALNLFDYFDNQERKVQTLHSFLAHVDYWKKHLNETLKPLLSCYNLALKKGNTRLAAQNLLNYMSASYLSGEKLTTIKRAFLTETNNISKIKQEKIYLKYIYLWYQIVFNLTDSSCASCNITGDFYNEKNMLSLYQEKGNIIGAVGIYFNKMILCYLYYNYVQGNEQIKWLEQRINYLKVLPLFPVFYFYSSLLKISLLSFDFNPYQDLPEDLNITIKKMKKWADNAPMNYQHKYDLIKAELNRLKHNKEKAADFYQKAIEGAYEHQYINEEALAYELAAKFYLEWNKFEIAQLYMQKARYKYQLWGAIAKVKHLEEKYSNIFTKKTSYTTNSDISHVFSPKDTSKFKLENFDLAILIKTNQAISKEENLDKLLALILNFSLQAVGAQEGLIIFNESGTNLIKSEAKIEGKEIIIQSSERVSKTQKFPKSVVNYVRNTREIVAEGNASFEGKFINDDYVVRNKALSILCLPLISQGKFVAVIYLENNLVANIFKEDDLGVLELITTQAAISIENAMLRKQKSYVSEHYRLGASLKADDPSYVKRESDDELYQNLIKGNYCYILNARQMGKSSLRVRIDSQLKSLGYRCALVDVSAIPSEEVTRSGWYVNFLDVLARNFPELKTSEFKNWLNNASTSHPNVEGLAYFIEEILLSTIKEDIVIFVEEIDSIRRLSFSINDFFSLIRSFYNYRATRPEFERISFVFIGAALPTDLVTDPNVTPFNIGTRIELSPFKLEETEPLIKGFKDKCERSKVVMEQILHWTGGQPFLTQKVCSLVQLASENVPTNNEADWIAQLVQNKIIGAWKKRKGRIKHLTTIQRYVLYNEFSPQKLLILYRAILMNEEIIYDPDIREHEELLIIGIAKVEDDRLKVFNRIYESIFNIDWVEKYLNSN